MIKINRHGKLAQIISPRITQKGAVGFLSRMGYPEKSRSFYVGNVEVLEFFPDGSFKWIIQPPELPELSLESSKIIKSDQSDQEEVEILQREA